MNWKVFLLVFLFPALLCAQTPIQLWPPGEDKITPLKLGEKAPHDGQLFDPSTALRWGYAIQQYQLRLKLDVQLQKDICKAEITYRDKLLTIETSRAKAVESDLQARLLRSEKRVADLDDRLRNPPWYTTRTFGVVVGVVGTALVFGASIWAFHEIRD